MTESKRPRPPSPSPAAAADVSKVLDDSDLLWEILIRLDFPTWLVQAALVCKRWLAHASDPVFLCRFEERHPPRLLGFYAESACKGLQQFVPLPGLPPELAPVVRRPASFDLTTEFYWNTSIEHCRNGRLLLRHTGYHKSIFKVRSPLNLARDGAVVATCPMSKFADDERYFGHMLLPDEVRYERPETLQLSLRISHQAVHSGVYLINLVRFKILVWLHSTDGNNTGTWVLVDTICLSQAFGHLVKSGWESGSSCISLAGSGDNAEFVFLGVDDEIFCMYIGSRTVEKVYEMEYKNDQLFRIYPFMMVWPPIFPALVQRHDEEKISEGLPPGALHND